MKIEQLQARKAVLNLAGIGTIAFGRGSAAAQNLPVKVRRNRQLKAEEANAIFTALAALGLYFQQPATSNLFITTKDIQRVADALNITGIADLAFGKGTSAASTFRTKIATGRSLNSDESEAVMAALAGLEVWIEHRD